MVEPPAAAVPGMRPPELAECWLELRCCKGITLYPVKLMERRHGDRTTMAAVLGRLRCSKGQGRPAPVYLN